jgi:DNA-binding transcriptional LysR family regulator
MQIIYDDLKTFITVVDFGSYSNAAKHLGITRTTISRRIAKLEDITENKLLIINTYNFKITNFGQELYNSIVDEVKSFDVFIDSLTRKLNANKEISGDLRVQLPPMLSMHHISSKLPAFLKNNPKINLAVFYSKDFEVDIIKHELDLAVVNHIPSKQDQKVRKIFSYDIGLFCTTEYQEQYGIPESIEELQEHLILGYARENYKLEKLVTLTNIIENRQIKFEMPNRLMGNSEVNTIALLNSNEAIVPLILYKDMNKYNPRIVRVLPDWIIKDFLTYYILINPFSNETNVKAFYNFIQECLSDIKQHSEQ